MPVQGLLSRFDADEERNYYIFLYIYIYIFSTSFYIHRDIRSVLYRRNDFVIL